MSALPRPSAPPGRLPPVGTPPGANRPAANRTFGPPPPSSLGGPRPAPKPGGPVAGEGQTDVKKDDVVFDDVHDDLDVLRNAIDLSNDEKMPPTDQIIKELVEDDAPKTPTKPAPNGGPAGRPEIPRPSVPPAASASPDKQAEEGGKDAPGDKPTAEPDNGSPAAALTAAAAVGATAAGVVAPAPKPPAPDASKDVKPSAETSGPVPGKPPRLETDKKARPDWVLPDMSKMLKNAVRKSISDEELRHRAEVIEQTLSSFGAPGRVVEVNHGPVITQFGVEPDYIDGRAGKRIKVKVGKIGALADDLALALAAPSIRIEAPVPGKGYVGVEVPNAEPSLVGLRDVMDTPEFRSLKSPLKLALGQDVSGQAVVADLTGMPHLLIAGTTGSGKSVCVNGIICTMLMTCSPDELKLIMVDPKRVELTNYNGIPHLMAPVVTELERIVGVLKWVQREMDDRYRAFAMAGARNITDYNGRVEKKQIEGERLPYIIVIVDELADLMMLAPDETERVITRLAQMARATGIHIIISTQRPSVDVVTGLIKANFPSRIAFAVATGVDLRVIMDMPGAEKLLGRGDMLFQAPDAPMPLRLQGIFVSDEEIQKIVDYWREEATKMPSQTTNGTLSSPPTSGVKGAVYSSPVGVTVGQQKELFNADDDADEDVDDLFDEAVELVRGMEKASISLLQRHLRIGYTRAARLIDLMEEREVIGPHAGGSKPREVLDSEDEGHDDSDDNSSEDDSDDL